MTRIPWALALRIAGVACGTPITAPTTPAPAPGTILRKARPRCKAGFRWDAERRECVSPDGARSGRVGQITGSSACRPAIAGGDGMAMPGALTYPERPDGVLTSKQRSTGDRGVYDVPLSEDMDTLRCIFPEAGP